MTRFRFWRRLHGGTWYLIRYFASARGIAVKYEWTQDPDKGGHIIQSETYPI